MNRFVRFFNQNRKAIFWTILIIALILIVIQLINQRIKNRNENAVNMPQEQTSLQTNIIKENNELVSDKSIISGERLSESANSSIQIIREFINDCNNGDVNSAYNLISDDCKEIMFSDINTFKDTYYNDAFDGNKKEFTVENWNNSIYRIKLNDANAISTGKANEEAKTDYITIVKDNDGNLKLNINGFIKKENLNKEVNYKNIKVRAENLYQFMDYCEISYSMENNTYRTVLMDDLTNPYTMYLLDTNGNKYSAVTNELVSERLKMGIDQKTQITIKYYYPYGSTKELDKAVFSKVINNFETYDTLRDISQYGQYYSIEVEL